MDYLLDYLMLMEEITISGIYASIKEGLEA
jgi:hypothetical protein